MTSASSSSSYRLETPRSKHPPPPALQFVSNSSSFNSAQSSPTSQFLFQDRSFTAASRSPPPSAPSLRTSSSSNPPSSPSYRQRHAHHLRGNALARSRRTTPPPHESRREMAEFAAQCRAWYYDQDDQAGRQVSQIMANLPASQRAPYMKLQASIRSGYHASVNARRLAEFKAQLSSTSPGGSLTPSARAEPHSSIAQKERCQRLRAFIDTWCTQSMPGPKPFFQGLWGAMRLQVLPAQLGGAGKRRIEWEIDDAVFRETAGKDFMLDAVTIMKGVLGFDDSSPISSDSPIISSMDLVDTQAYPQDQQHESRSRSPLARIRAPSDPFLDSSKFSGSHRSPSNEGATTKPFSFDTAVSLASNDDILQQLEYDIGFDTPDEQQLRVWIVPDLSNPEFLSLLSLFPTSITRSTLPRFAVKPLRSTRKHDLEEGLSDHTEQSVVKCGSGRMWVGSQERSEHWKGGWLMRFLAWCRTMFC